VLDKNVSLKEMVALENIEEHFYLHLSTQAFDELIRSSRSFSVSN
jgi:hypothetical protein